MQRNIPDNKPSVYYLCLLCSNWQWKTEPAQKCDLHKHNLYHFRSELQAFIWDSPRLEYEAAHDCDLTTAGDLFGRSGLGIGLQKNSPWTHEVSMAVLELHESESDESFLTFYSICILLHTPSDVNMNIYPESSCQPENAHTSIELIDTGWGWCIFSNKHCSFAYVYTFVQVKILTLKYSINSNSNCHKKQCPIQNSTLWMQSLNNGL